MRRTTILAALTAAIFAASVANAKEFRSQDVHAPVFSLGQPQPFVGRKFPGQIVLAAPPAGHSYILRG